MTKLISAYVAASNLLFERRKPKRKASMKNPVAEIFGALAQDQQIQVEQGNPLSESALAEVATASGFSAEECARQIDLFLYWREHSKAYLN